MQVIMGNITKERILIIAGLTCAVLLSGIILYQNIHPVINDNQQDKAIHLMQEMVDEVSDYCLKHGLSIDEFEDPGNTGLIGPEWTEMTTTIGHLEAKRTTIQPDFAALALQLFKEAGLGRGDTIAIGCSGSFPGLLLACLSAAEASGIECKTILSLGASSHGANRLNLTILDIYNILYSKGLIKIPPIAVSLGGENDLGETWESGTHNALENSIIKSGYRYISHPTLVQSVASRERLYGFSSNNENIKVFINAGGAMANIGTSASILKLKPGLVKTCKIPEKGKQGLIHRAIINDIQVIHLLNIKGLALEYGLKWDPVIR